MELDWKKNLGVTDRVNRVIIGIILLLFVSTKTIVGWWATGGIILALFQFVEAFFGY